MSLVETANGIPEVRLKGLLSRLNLGVFRSTPDGRLLYANEAFLGILGYTTLEDAIATGALIPLLNRIEPASRGSLGDSRATDPLELDLQRASGEKIWVSAWMAVSVEDANIIEGFFADITNRKRLQAIQSEKEAAVKQAEKLESLGRLCGGVAHDFNNLLTAITGYSELLLSTLGAESPARPDVMEINRAGMRATRLTRELLAFGRRQFFQNRILDLNGIVRAVDPAAWWCPVNGIEFRMKLEEPLHPILADPIHIETIIANLVGNARDALPSGGVVVLTTSNLEVGEERAIQDPQGFFSGFREVVRPGRYVSFSVADNGAGMDPAMLSRVFDPFFTTKHASKGAGLGLSTVYGIVKQSEGHVLVESEPGKGTTFCVLLPAAG